MAATHTLKIIEPVGQSWPRQLVRERFTFDPGEFPGTRAWWIHRLDNLHSVMNPVAVPAQMDVLSRHSDGSIQEAEVIASVELQPNETVEMELVAELPDNLAVSEGYGLLAADRTADGLHLRTDKLSIRLPNSADYPDGRDAADVPGPISEFNGKGAKPAGESRLSGDLRVRRIQTECLADGPLELRARVTYDFAGGETYTCDVSTWRGADVLLLREKSTLTSPDYVTESWPHHRVKNEYWNAPAWTWDMCAPEDTACVHMRLNQQRNYPPQVLAAANMPESMEGQPGGADNHFTFPARVVPGRDVAWLFPFSSWTGQEGSWFGIHEMGKQDYLGLFALSSSVWRNAYENEPVLCRDDSGRLRLHAPIRTGERYWGLWAGTPAEAFPQSPHATARPQYLRNHLGNLALDKIRRWPLNAPAETPATYPRIFLDRETWPDIRERIRRTPDLHEALERWRADNPEGAAYQTAPEQFLATGELPEATALALMLDDQFRALIQTALKGDGWDSWLLGVLEFPQKCTQLFDWFDWAMSCAELPANLRNRLYRHATFIACCLADRDRWPRTGDGYFRGTHNFIMANTLAISAAACVLRRLPEARSWGEETLAELEHCLRIEDPLPPPVKHWADAENEKRGNVGPNGAWAENPSYMCFGLTLLWRMAVNLRNGGHGDLTTSEALTSVLRFAIDLLTPPDPRFDDQRAMVGLGDISLGLRSDIFLWGIRYLQDTCPELAANLQWAYIEQFGEFDWAKFGFREPLLLAQPDVQPVPISGESRHYPGFGAIIRRNFNTPRESYLAARFGSFCWGHYHTDNGSFAWFPHGVPLCPDIASGYAPRVAAAECHNRICIRQSDDWPLADPDAVKIGNEIDYISMETEIKLLQPRARPDRDPVITETEHLSKPVRWRRDFLHVAGREPDIPAYIVLRDTVGDTDEPWSWSIWALADEPVRNGDGWRLVGDYGIDLWVWFDRDPDIEADGFRYTSTQGAGGAFRGTPEMRNGFMNHRFRREEFKAGQTASQSGGYDGLQQRLSAVRVNKTGPAEVLAVLVALPAGSPPPDIRRDTSLHLNWHGCRDKVVLDDTGRSVIRTCTDTTRTLH